MSLRWRSGIVGAMLSLILILVVVLIAFAGLWFMRSLSHVSGAVAGKNDLDSSIEKFLGGRDGKGNPKVANGANANVLAVLSSSYTDRQVPLDSVQCNPFILPGEGQAKSSVPIISDNSDAAMAQAREARQKDFATAAERLTLKSIIMSSQPLANVSGMIVREGDELSPENSDVTFTVERIDSDSVLLIANDIALGLKMEFPLTMKRDK